MKHLKVINHLPKTLDTKFYLCKIFILTWILMSNCNPWTVLRRKNYIVRFEKRTLSEKCRATVGHQISYDTKNITESIQNIFFVRFVQFQLRIRKLHMNWQKYVVSLCAGTIILGLI